MTREHEYKMNPSVGCLVVVEGTEWAFFCFGDFRTRERTYQTESTCIRGGGGLHRISGSSGEMLLVTFSHQTVPVIGLLPVYILVGYYGITVWTEDPVVVGTLSA